MGVFTCVGVRIARVGAVVLAFESSTHQPDQGIRKDGVEQDKGSPLHSPC